MFPKLFALSLLQHPHNNLKIIIIQAEFSARNAFSRLLFLVIILGKQCYARHYHSKIPEPKYQHPERNLKIAVIKGDEENLHY